MKIKRTRVIALVIGGALALVVLLLAATGVWAGPSGRAPAGPLAPASVVSGTLTYQGRLLDGGGEPVDGTTAMTFRLYDVPSGGTALWTQVQNVEVERGLFNAYLDVDTALFNGQALWLGVQVAGDAQELAPRQPLLPAPYAFHALSAPWSGLTGVPPGLSDGDDDTLGGLSCANGQIAEWNGSAWVCAADDDSGGDITAVYAGTGLSGGGTVGAVTLSADTTYLQRRVGSTCAAGSSIRVVNADGTVTCEGDDDTTYTNGTGLNLAGNQFSVGSTYRLPQSCAGSQIAEWDGSAWQCGNDDTGAGTFWSLTGNSGTDPSINYLGTSDGVSLTLAVNAASALRLEPNGVSPNLVGGYGGNSVAPGVVGATIGGGGDSTYPNWVIDDYGTVGGGVGNTAGTADDDADYVTVGGGCANVASGGYGTIAGGDGNLAAANHTAIGGGLTNQAFASFSTVGGGEGNVASGTHATVGGGEGNVASGTHATVGGGESNVASGANATVGGGGYNNYATAAGSTVGGGFGNDATGAWSTVGGGKDNVASGDFATVGGGDVNCATGAWSTVGGGSWNTASGDYSFAAGREAWTNHGGSFVWSSGESTSSWYTNTFTVRAHGGVRFYSGPGTSVGVQLWSGTSAWGFISDRNVKENFADVDAARVLETLAAMPIQTWNLKTQSPDMRHVGPVAQDFNGEFAYLFGKVESPTHINSADAIGVALVAIQGLYAQNDSLRAKSIELAAENSELRQRVEALETENAAQQAQLDDMEARLAALEAAGGTSQTSGLQIPGGWWALGGLVIVAAVVGQRRLGGGR